MNPYQVLGVERDASDKDVKAAYRKLSAIHHPDKEGGDEEEFRRIKEAYDVLSDPSRRARYDKTGRTDKSPVTPEAIRSILTGTITSVIEHERPDGTTDDPCWDDIKMKIILSIQASRREVVANIKRMEKKLDRTRLLQARFKPRQEADPVGEIFAEKVKAMEDQLQGFKDALELSLETQRVFEQYDYEVGPGPEGQVSPGPTPRLAFGRGSVVFE